MIPHKHVGLKLDWRRVVLLVSQLHYQGVVVEGVVTRPLPAQIPACGTTAPGSSDSLASAIHCTMQRLRYSPQ